LSLILYFSLATSPDPLIAGLWLLPLTVSFLLQPHGREIWSSAPTQAELTTGTATRSSLEGLMAGRRPGRVLTLAREGPERGGFDLALGARGSLSGRRPATGYAPIVPRRTRLAFDGMSVGGLLPGAFFRSAAARLEAADVRWVQLPASALVTAGD